MKSYLKLFTFLVLAIETARALECYRCEFHEGAKLERGFKQQEDYLDDSCKNHKTPKKEFAKDCGSGYDVCVKFFVDGERRGTKIKSTLRNCSSKNFYPEFEMNTCKFKEGKELGDLVGVRVPANSKGTICVCDGDKCNSSSMLKFKNSLFVLIIVLFVVKLLN